MQHQVRIPRTSLIQNIVILKTYDTLKVKLILPALTEAENSIKENIIPLTIKNEKIVQRLSSDNHFFYLTMTKRSDEFVIYDFIDIHYRVY